MKYILMMFVCALAITGCNKKTNIVPWVELNSMKAESIARTISGLREWAKLSDTAIVSTQPGNEHVYKELAGQVDGIKIIPGIKTRKWLRTYDSIDGWKRIADSVRKVIEITGADTILLENETARLDYTQGRQDISLIRFEFAIKQLPTGIKYILWPSVVGTGQKRERVIQTCEIFNRLHDVTFIDRKINRPDHVEAEHIQESSRRLREFTNDFIQIAYFYGRPDFWSGSDIRKVLRLSQGKTFIAYPGVANWLSVPRELKEALLAKDTVSIATKPGLVGE